MAEVCTCAFVCRCGSAHRRLCIQTVFCTQSAPHAVRALHTVGLVARGSVAVQPVPLSTHPIPAPPRPSLPTPAPGQAGQAAPAGRGAASGAGRLFRALARCPGPARQAARGRRRSQKEGLCRRPALGRAARRQGLGEGDAAGTAAGADPPPPPGRPQTPRLAGTSGRLAPPGAGGGRQQARGLPRAPAARPGRTRGGSGEGRGP